MMTFAIDISQQYYNFTDSRSEKEGVKELNTKHVPYDLMWYKEMQARPVMHSGERDDSYIPSVWQQSVCIWSSSIKTNLPAKRIVPIEIPWN